MLVLFLVIYAFQIVFINVPLFAVENGSGPDAERAAMVSACFTKFNFQSTVPKGDAEEEQLFGRVTGNYYGNSYEGAQGSEVTIPATKLVAADESMECRSVLGTLLQKLGSNYDDFFSKYYEVIDDNDDGNFNDYGLKSGVTSEKIESDIRRQITEAGLSANISSSPDDMPTGYMKAVLSTHFESCFKESTQDSDFTINDQNYVYIGGDGKDARADRRVGLLIDPDDGIWSCREIGEKLENTSTKYGEPPATLSDIVLGDAVSDEELGKVPGQKGGSGDGSEQGDNANCMANANGFGLAWFLCPIYNVAETAMNKMLSYIADMMYSKLDSQDAPGLREAWGNLRNVANTMFVFALLIVIIGQAVKGSW